MEVAQNYKKENIRLRKQIQRLIDSCNHKLQTHPKPTNSMTNSANQIFIDSLSSVDQEDKNKVKNKILQLNVLSESIKNTYIKSTIREKRTLKEIVKNPFTSKYKIVTHHCKTCIGLVGKIKKVER